MNRTRRDLAAHSHWAHGRACYRCEHGYTSPVPAAPANPRTLCLREDRLLAAITHHIAEHRVTAEHTFLDPDAASSRIGTDSETGVELSGDHRHVGPAIRVGADLVEDR